MIGIAAFPGESDPRWTVETPIPTAPAAHHVLCQTIELGVCGTDRDILESKAPWVPPGDEKLVLGHECLARIVVVGGEVTEFSPGDLVVPVVRRAFNRQELRPDMLPFGSFTERGIVQEHGFSFPFWIDEPRYLFRVPRAIAATAVLTEPISVAEKGVQEAWGVQRGRLGAGVWRDPPPRVLVTGQGPIAFACLLVCYARRWPVTMFGRDPSESFRSQLAQRLEAVYLPAVEFPAAVRDVEQEGFDLILECTGNDEVMMIAAQALASCGVMVWLGSSRTPQARSHAVDRLMRHGVLRNHVFLGTVNAAPRDFDGALKHLMHLQQTCPRELAAVITDRVPWRDSLWHYRHRVPQGIKTVVMFD